MPTSSSSSSSCVCSSLKCKTNKDGVVVLPNLLFEAKTISGLYSDNKVSGYNNLIIYNKSGNDYYPVFESTYISEKSGIAYSGYFEKNDFKVRLKNINIKSGSIEPVSSSGIQVLNLIDVSLSNEKSFKIFQNEYKQKIVGILYENLLENISSREIAILQFAGPDLVSGSIFFTGYKDLNQTINSLKIKSKIYEGVDFERAFQLAKNYPWNKNKLKMINIISNNTSYIKQKNLSTGESCIIDYYPESNKIEAYSYEQIEEDLTYFQNSGIIVNYFDFSIQNI